MTTQRLSNSFMFIVCLQAIQSQSDTYAWLPASSLLPRSDSCFAVGSYNDSIFLIGGYSYQYQFVEYRIDLDTFIDFGIKTLSTSTWSYSQFYTQREETVYMIQSISSFTSTLASFNLKTKQFTSNWLSIALNKYVGNFACLASSTHHLFVVGGPYNSTQRAYLSSVQVLSLLTYEWILNIPKMNQGRGAAACVIHNDNIWAFGGFQSSTTTEFITIQGIVRNSWSYTTSLTTATYYSRAVTHQHIIYIIGGSQTILQMFNTITYSVSSSSIPYVTHRPGVVSLNDIIYVFGGVNLNKWMQYKVVAPDPTNAPSSDPTNPPTSPPTKVPTEMPTLPPSALPSEYPSINPTVYPSEHPSPYPSLWSINTEEPNESEEKKGGSILSNNTFLYGVLALAAAFIVALICFNGFYWQNKSRKALEQQNNMENVDNLAPLPDEIEGDDRRASRRETKDNKDDGLMQQKQHHVMKTDCKDDVSLEMRKGNDDDVVNYINTAGDITIGAQEEPPLPHDADSDDDVLNTEKGADTIMIRELLPSALKNDHGDDDVVLSTDAETMGVPVINNQDALNGDTDSDDEALMGENENMVIDGQPALPSTDNIGEDVD